MESARFDNDQSLYVTVHVIVLPNRLKCLLCR